MSRYMNVVSSSKTPAELNQTVGSYLSAQGFRQIDPAQNIWKKGMGLLLGPHFVRFEAQPGCLRLEGWIKFALLPGVYIGEMGVDGLFAIIPKRQLKSKLMEIERITQG
jgi:hypothetical protein